MKKRDVIKAIASESLLDAQAFAKTTHEGCSFCAVGTVLKKALQTDDILQIDKAGIKVCGKNYISSDLEDAWIDGKFLSILSCEFEKAYALSYYVENISKKDAVELARLHAISVTEALCPDILKFEI